MFDRFHRERAAVGAPEFLVVGLGNPDRKYTLTRHNSGFLCVDEFAEKNNVKINKLKFKAVVADAVIGSHRVILMKPQTYMNNSGEAVKEAAAFYKIPPEKIIIIFDDISLDVGKLRIKRKGTDGGHNGIKSIINCVGSTDFPRIKLGVGKKPHPDYDLADWVLSEFKKDESVPLKSAIDNACDALLLILDGKIDEAMNKFNS